MKKQASNKAGKQQTATLGTSNSSPYPQSSTNILPNRNRTWGPSTSHSLQSSTPQPNAPKVAIPRLHRQNEDQPMSKLTAAGDKNRVAHACESCRHRKTKCSGERPVCQHCQDLKLACVYADGKRDRTKKQLGSLAGKVEEYEQLLKELSLRVGAQDQECIRRALDREQSSGDDSVLTGASPRAGRKESREPAGEDKVSARTGSTEPMDRVSEDFNRGFEARATGFHGKNSEITWMQRLQSQTSQSSDEEDESEEEMSGDYPSPKSQSHHPGNGLQPISATSYHCDDVNLLLHERIDPREMPPQNTANVLFQCFLDTVHPFFPIIGRTTFMQQYNIYCYQPCDPSQNWLAILNMIFAIGAKYSYLVRADWRGDTGDHLVYFTRARMLGFDADAILGHAELQKVQIAGLMAFYLLATHQINRAWSVSGVAIRHALTLGLNLRNESQNITDDSKEIRCRVWWAVCSTERLLAVMTGRSTSFAGSHCTTPSPLPLEEESFVGASAESPQVLQLLRRRSSQDSRLGDYRMTAKNTESSKKKASQSNTLSPASPQPSSQEQEQSIPPCSALAFRYLTELVAFTDDVLTHLYRTSAMTKSWADVQATISKCNTELDNWRQKLPLVFDFTRKQSDQRFVPQRMSLGFFYQSTRILINRPCLCRINRKSPDQSDRAKTFNNETAARCVHAARNMLEMLPSEPNPVRLYQTAPWWCLVHWLVQATTVSMLELSFRAEHMPNEVHDVFDTAEKALEWLRIMSNDDEAARRAAKICTKLLRQIAHKLGKTVRFQELPSQAPSDMQYTHDVNDEYPYQNGAHTQNVHQMNPFVGAAPTQNVQAGYSGSSPYSAPFAHPTSAPSQAQAFTSYDQMPHYGQFPIISAQTPFDDMFVTCTGVDSMDIGNVQCPDYFQGQNQDWFPGSCT